MDGVHLVGDPTFDAVARHLPLAHSRVTPLARLGVERGGYALATVHRPANVDDPARLARIAEAFSRLELPVVCPVHPRTRARIEAAGAVEWGANVLLAEPVGWLEMLVLEASRR